MISREEKKLLSDIMSLSSLLMNILKAGEFLKNMLLIKLSAGPLKENLKLLVKP